jgi:hypothetical protein
VRFSNLLRVIIVPPFFLKNIPKTGILESQSAMGVFFKIIPVNIKTIIPNIAPKPG